MIFLSTLLFYNTRPVVLIMPRLLLREGVTTQKRTTVSKVKLAAFSLTLVFFVACICWRLITSTLFDNVDRSHPIKKKITVISDIMNSNRQVLVQVWFDFPVPPSEWLADMNTTHTSTTCSWTQTNNVQKPIVIGKETSQRHHCYSIMDTLWPLIHSTSLRKPQKAGNWHGISQHTLPSGTSWEGLRRGWAASFTCLKGSCTSIQHSKIIWNTFCGPNFSLLRVKPDANLAVQPIKVERNNSIVFSQKWCHPQDGCRYQSCLCLCISWTSSVCCSLIWMPLSCWWILTSDAVSTKTSRWSWIPVPGASTTSLWPVLRPEGRWLLLSSHYP